MSTVNEDLGQLQKKLDDWAGKIPQEAQEFHKRRTALAQQIRASTGIFGGRDAAQVAEIMRKALDLEGDIPALELLLNVARRTRAKVIEFRAAPAPDPKIQALVEEWGTDWLTLIDFLVSRVGDRKAAAPATAQVQQIEIWAVDRKRALAILSEASALRAEDVGPSLKASLDSALRFWTTDFIEGRTDTAWLDQSDKTVKTLSAEYAAETRNRVKPQPKVEPQKVEPQKTEPLKVQTEPPKPKVVEQKTPEPQKPEPPKNEPPEEESSSMHFHRIDGAMAESSDLADALKEDRAGLRVLDARYWQLRSRPDVPLAEVAELEQDIETYRLGLQDRASHEVARRLRRLQLRWQWFKAVYGGRDEIALMVQKAETTQPDGAGRLRDFIDNVIEAAEQRINAVVNSNRPLLAAFVNRASDNCRAQVDAVRAEPRLISIDAALVTLRGKIPEATGSQVNADELFERLDLCDALKEEISALDQQNAQKQVQLKAQAADLKKLAAQLTAVAGGTEASAIAARIPDEIPPDRTLDDTEADLNRLGLILNGQLTRVRQTGANSLVKLRKENQAWIRLLSPLTPEVATFSVADKVPEDLDALRTALDVEGRYEQRIAALAIVAAHQLATRRDTAATCLRHHLSTPAFETHPERETAQAILDDLDAVPPLAEPAQREDFDQTCQLVVEAEDFIERIESTQREIPDRLADLEERLSRLNALNGIMYRRDLAHRLNTLIKGVRRGIEREQWESLNYQLKEANTLFAAIERDALLRISAETEEVVGKLEQMTRNTNDAIVVGQIQSALKQLEEQGDIEPPSYSIRKRLQGLTGRRTSSLRRTP